MNILRKLQHEFFNYLLDDSERAIVKKIESTAQGSAEQRMKYYGNAYNLRLQEALETDYERLHYYLGDELFATLMQKYIEQYPSHHPSLRYFGQHMVKLVEQLEPFSQHIEIAEITRIEQAFAHSFDAADCKSVTHSDLTQLNPNTWATLNLCFHDAVQLLPQEMNSFQIWKALSEEVPPPEKEQDKTTWLIWRQDLVSRYRALEAAELNALNIAMTKGSNFGDICSGLLEHFSEEETPQKAVNYLQQWINDQMVCGLN